MCSTSTLSRPLSVLLCRQAEQISRCVRFWGAAVGDVHRATALEWTGADAGHLPSDSAQEEAAVPVRYTTTTTGAASSSSSPSCPLTLLLLPLPPHLLCCIFFFLSSNSPAAASSAAASSSLSSAASSSPSCPLPLLLLPLHPSCCCCCCCCCCCFVVPWSFYCQRKLAEVVSVCACRHTQHQTRCCMQFRFLC